jgi:ribosomal protein L37AE/L43A
MSDVSGISTTSNKTYVSEDSSLVLETLESGHHHHYLIPMTAARRGKFKKAGTKLHIYMDHIFTAQHIKLGTKCDACSRVIPLRLGKQAYVCRDCGTTTHKQCHTKVDTHCLQTTLPTMELEFYSEDSVTKIHH